MNEKNIKLKAIGERIRKIRGGLSQEQFAKRLGVHRNTVARYERGEREPDFGFIEKLRMEFNINPEWLLFGEGPMYRGQKAEETPPATPLSTEDEYVFVPLLESYVTAGPDGGLIFEPKDFYPFKKSWIMRKFGRSPEHWKSLVLLPVRGDSMIPTIYPGEVVLVDTWESERLEPRSGKIYLIRQPDGGLSIKRLVLKEKEGKLILVCLSDNPNYEPFEIEIDPDRGLKYYVLGRIRWVGREVD